MPGPAPVLIALAVALFGLVWISLAPPRLRLRERDIGPRGTRVAPVDAQGLGHADFAVDSGRTVSMVRLFDDEARTVWRRAFDRDAAVTGAMDVTGDNSDELCVSLADSSSAVAQILDRDGRRMFELGPTRPAARAGHPWRGRITLDACLDQAGRRKAVCRLEGAGGPCGVAVYDLARNTVDWLFPLSSAPSRVRIGDLDDDGRPELLIPAGGRDGAAAASAVAGEESHSRVIAVRETGERMWQVTVGGPATGCEVLPLAASGEHPARVVAVTNPARGETAEPARIFLLEGRTGRELSRLEFASGLRGASLIATGAPRFVVGGNDGTVRVFDTDLRLLQSRAFAAPVVAWRCVDLDGDGESEVLASTPREILVLDSRLAVRGRIAVEGAAGQPPEVTAARAGLTRWRLCVADGRARAIDVVPEPPLGDPPRLGMVLGMALLAGVGSGFSAAALRRRGLPAGAAAREFLIDYHQIRHETFGHERPFARVRLWAQAAAARQPLPADVLDSACEEYRRLGLLTLARFASRARALRVNRERVDPIVRHSRRVAELLQHARAAAPEERSRWTDEALATITQLSEACGAAYRDVAERRACRPDHEVHEAVLAKRAALDRARVGVDIEIQRSGSRPVLFDAVELRTLLGELIENSARALSGTRDARLAIAVAGHPRDPRWIVVRLTDNGPGIPLDRRETVFAPGASNRPGGGFGLSYARETARRWLGELALVEPIDGRGTHVRLTLQAFQTDAPIAEPDPAAIPGGVPV